MLLRRNFALSLILGLRKVLFCVIYSVELLPREVYREYPLPSRFHHEKYQHLSRKLLKRPFEIQGLEEPSLLQEL